MRALVLERPGPIADDPLELIDRDDPEPAAGELILRVTACAVCRTDLQIVTGDLAPHRSPVVPGHQVVGVVTAVGQGVEGWALGERAGITWLAGFDGTCRFCRSGRENLCQLGHLHRLGSRWRLRDRRGGARRRRGQGPGRPRRPRRCAAPVRRGDRLSGPARLSGIEPGARLGLYGFGASARQAIQVARHWGCDVHVASRARRDLERATELGASSVGGYDDAPPAPLDAAITFAPVGSVVISALRAIDRGGTVVVNAIHLDGIPAFSYDDLWWERSIRSVANVTRADAAEFLDLAAAIGIVSDVESHPLAAGNEALRRLEAGEIAGAAVLLPT